MNQMNSINLRSSIDQSSPSKRQAAALKADPSKLAISIDFSTRRKSKPQQQRSVPQAMDLNKHVNAQKLLEAVNQYGQAKNAYM